MVFITWVLPVLSIEQTAPSHVKGNDIYSIGLYRFNSFDELVTDRDKTFSKIITAEDVTDIDARFVADPFLVRHQDQWYLFFEALKNIEGKRHGKGVICLATSKDLQAWHYEKVVIEEDFLLSYPYVFSHNGEYYMIPTAYRQDEVRLYKAHAFPFDWRLEKVLLNANNMDPSIVQHNGKWWIFTETNPTGHDQLSIFWADDLLGPWQPHAGNPLKTQDPHYSRPCGRLQMIDGQLYRFAQDDSPDYGLKVFCFRIDELTPQNYYESLVSNLPILQGSGNSADWNGRGMHHIDIHETHDGISNYVAAVDGWTTMTPTEYLKAKQSSGIGTER